MTSDRAPVTQEAEGLPRGDETVKVLLVCSPGGHFQQMLALERAWIDTEKTWVTLRAPDTEPLLGDEKVVWGHGPTNRSVRKLIRNTGLAIAVFRRTKPQVVLSTGAGLAVPFVVLARVTGRRAVYVESFTRTKDLSLTGRLVYIFATAFFVQWPAAGRGRRKARYVGAIL